MTVIPTIAIPTVKGIHSGAVTHHHDQVATCPTSASFKVKNIRNKIVNTGNAFFFEFDILY